MKIPKPLNYANMAALTVLILGAAFNLFVNGLPGLIELIGKSIPIITIFLTLSAYKSQEDSKHITPLVLNAISLAMYTFVLTLFQSFNGLAVYFALFGLLCLFNIYFIIKNLIVKNIKPN